MSALIDVPRAEAVLDVIAEHPETHRQEVWRCLTGMCFAGHAVALFSDLRWLWSEEELRALITKYYPEVTRLALWELNRIGADLLICRQDHPGANPLVSGLHRNVGWLFDEDVRLEETIGRSFDPSRVWVINAGDEAFNVLAYSKDSEVSIELFSPNHELHDLRTRVAWLAQGYDSDPEAERDDG